jgi:hypothetical protein
MLFFDFTKELIQVVVSQLQKIAAMVNEIESEVEFFGDNDFLGSPPYANVDSFQRSWDQLKVRSEGYNNHFDLFTVTFARLTILGKLYVRSGTRRLMHSW